MTSFAFIFGVVPLVIAEGAGAEMRRSLGTAVFSGMLGVTLFGIFLTPVFYYVIQRFGTAKEPEPLPAMTNGIPPASEMSARWRRCRRRRIPSRAIIPRALCDRLVGRAGLATLEQKVGRRASAPAKAICRLESHGFGDERDLDFGTDHGTRLGFP